MQARISLALVALLAAASLCIAGCDGGGDPQPLSMAAFTKQANQICAGAESKVEEEERAISGEIGESSEEGAASYVSHFLNPWVGTATTELSELGLPKGKAKEAEAMIAEYEKTLAKIEAEPKLALSKDPFAAANKMATELGLTECVI